MKASLRNPPDHFILYFWTKDLSPQKSCMEIAESIINPAYWLKKERHDVSVSTIIIYKQIFQFLRKLVKIMGKIDNGCFECYKKLLVLSLHIFLFLSFLFFFFFFFFFQPSIKTWKVSILLLYVFDSLITRIKIFFFD